MAASDDGSETVDAFLERIASLKVRRDREDDERARKLKEEIAQGRRERQVRRAERARSLSPVKDSPQPANPPFPTSSLYASSADANEPSLKLRPSPQPPSPITMYSMNGPKRPDTTFEEASDPSRPLPPTPTKASSPPRSAPMSATALLRSGTLSWQQRPSSRDSNSSRNRPLSGLSTESTPVKFVDAREPAEAQELSRKDIAASLGSKDPSWFRQTADRGIGSAALRRNQEIEEMAPETSSRSRQLPGIARERLNEQGGSDTYESLSTDRDFSTSTSSVAGQSRSPMPIASSQRFEFPFGNGPNEQNHDTETATNTTLPHGRVSPDRPPSPTKGLGGFVQSAMMKRSDSVKRWSTQAPQGLKRGDSVAGNRSTLGNFTGAPLTKRGSPPRERRTDGDQSSSPISISRPTSSHEPGKSSLEALSFDTFKLRPLLETQPTNEFHENEVNLDQPVPGSSTAQPEGSTAISKNPVSEIPTSPTKTLDTRRWSPTKASWLESALSKPESPKVMSAKPDIPVWKAGAQGLSQKPTKGIGVNIPHANFNVASPPGLLRSAPLGGHAKPLSIGGLPKGFSSGLVKKMIDTDTIPTKATQKSLPQNETAAAPVQSELTPRTLQAKSAKSETESAGNLESTSEGSAGSKPSAEAEGSSTPALNDTRTSSEQETSSKTKKEPPSIKPKAQTPPKTDLRANLKPRQKDLSDNAPGEPEFKNVFGKLRRTETKNYVAPDELKGNIQRGKAALNITGGPQKTKRVDEFKESILQKKEAMKAGGGSVHKKPDPGEPVVKPSRPVPEALARRNILSKSATALTTSLSAKSATPIEQKPASLSPVRFSAPSTNILDAQTPQSDETKISLASELTLPRSNAAVPVKLAGRFNPALATILSRGPPSAASTSVNKSSEDLTFPASLVKRTDDDSVEKNDGSLTHLTKGRAKGPKRRAPKGASEPMSLPGGASGLSIQNPVPAEASSRSVRDYTVLLSSNSPNPSAPPSPKIARTSQPLTALINQNEKIQIQKPASAEGAKIETIGNVTDPTSTKTKPAVAMKSPELRKVSSPPMTSAIKKPSESSFGDITRNGSDVANSGEKLLNKSVSSGPRSRSGPPKSTLTLKEKPFTPKRNQQIDGLGLEFAPSSMEGSGLPTPEPISKPVGPRSPTKPASPVKAIEQKLAQNKGHSQDNEISADATASRDALKFFDRQPTVNDKAEADTHMLVSSESDIIEKTRTVRRQIWEINADGKRSDMPPQQEHILFEECMYLCVHSFENTKASKTTEVYLWCGDDVGEAAIEDTQLFARKVARENGSKLDLMRQGKETPMFLQGLGGILITRRSKSAALYMLCGRRHLGHVVFDEVDMSPTGLCSGFPYLISARFGKLYLWKGSGSAADELGCARLIGMDLGLTGEIEEIVEGEEPRAFWESFSDSKSRPQSSPHLALKADHSRFACRLFRIDLDRPKSSSFWSRRGSSPIDAGKTASAQELSPFCQKDVEASNIYVLDAFFEIYIFIGTQACSKSVEFVTALFFAQEYSILAASLQDRPLIPSGHVIRGEPPRDCKAVFRKWTPPSDMKSPAVGSTAPTIIPLNDVIAALAQ